MPTKEELDPLKQETENLTPVELDEKRREQLYFKERRLSRADSTRETMEKELEEERMNEEEYKAQSTRTVPSKGGDWYTILMEMIRLTILHGKVLYAGSPAKAMTDSIKESQLVQMVGGLWSHTKDKMSWSLNRWAGLQKNAKLPDITFDVQIGDGGVYTSKALVNGSLPVQAYFGADGADSEGAVLAANLEKHLQEGFEYWLSTKGYEIEKKRDPDHPEVERLVIKKRSSDEVLTQAKLVELNEGEDSLTEVLSDRTKLEVTAEPTAPNTPRP